MPGVRRYTQVPDVFAVQLQRQQGVLCLLAAELQLSQQPGDTPVSDVGGLGPTSRGCEVYPTPVQRYGGNWMLL